MRALVFTFALVLSSSVALAQPVLTPPSATPVVPCPCVTAQLVEPTNKKEPAIATVLAIAGTVAPIALVFETADDSQAGLLAGFVGTLLLPSAGHWYAGTYLTPGMALRVAGAAATIGSASLLVQEDDGGGGGLAAIATVGALTFLSGIVFDVATAGSEAREWNAKHASLHPSVIATPVGGGTGVGLATTF